MPAAFRSWAVSTKRTSLGAGQAKGDATQDAALYEALLRAGIYEEALHDVLTANADAVEKQARSASKTMWKLLTTACG
jgi:hypothetical protein